MMMMRHHKEQSKLENSSQCFYPEYKWRLLQGSEHALEFSGILCEIFKYFVPWLLLLDGKRVNADQLVFLKSLMLFGLHADEEATLLSSLLKLPNPGELKPAMFCIPALIITNEF